MSKLTSFGASEEPQMSSQTQAASLDRAPRSIEDLAAEKKEAYAKKLQDEINVFNQIENVHALPGIFHHWSHYYLGPKFREMGVRGVYEYFFDYMSAACKASSGSCRFISLGSGQCEIEIEIVKLMLAAGHKNFVLECLDINEGMLNRGRELAVAASVAPFLGFVVNDASTWMPVTGSYEVVMAHQSLHHVVDLETLFEKTRMAIGDKGVFVVSDIIGRNGHMRWPEAMVEIDKIWAAMPDRYKYNHALKRFEATYENWDCSTEGFEGIRAQDILPLLQQYFSFEMFLGFGNLIDIFVDRAFGHNLDINSEEDKAFIDRVAERDDELIDSGRIKPTHIIAAMRKNPVANPRYYKHLTPSFCTRTVVK